MGEDINENDTEITLASLQIGGTGTIGLIADYETVGGGALTLSGAVNDYDVVPYIIKADGSILLGTPQLNFG